MIAYNRKKHGLMHGVIFDYVWYIVFDILDMTLLLYVILGDILGWTTTFVVKIGLFLGLSDTFIDIFRYQIVWL